MNHQCVPERVRQFTLKNIGSVAHLKAILIQRDSTKREWTVSEVAWRLHIEKTQPVY